MNYSNHRHWSTIAAVFFVVFFCQAKTTAGRSVQRAEWTILIFMNADNNLEPDGLNHFAELAEVGSTDFVNVVVQFDRIGKYAHTDPDWSETLRFLITKNLKPEPSKALERLGEVNMGDPAALRDFVKWGRSKFPANHYMLIMWDHGDGWRILMESMLKRYKALLKAGAIGSDYSLAGLSNSSVLLRKGSGVGTATGRKVSFEDEPGEPYRSMSRDETDKDVLYNREIEDSLKEALNGDKLDVIGFDACLMSMLETMYAMKDAGRYFVGSEELEPHRGWDYKDWLTAILNERPTDGAALAKLTVQSYERHYTNPNTKNAATTLSAFNLNQTQAIADSLSVLADKLSGKIDTEVQAISKARGATKNYAPGDLYHHVDLRQFLMQLQQQVCDAEIRSATAALNDLIRGAVVYNYAGEKRKGAFGSYGVAIYFPSSLDDYYHDPHNEGGYDEANTYFPVRFVQEQRWDNFLHTFWSKL